ncbi:serine hydroxymethyltransferase, mitochondrial-like [Cajanus cajan]|uniref:serine hydroxymethyltransferase, mitochondrial-like n=1 Tax=Cajanus cajan TaxID=3821 RepID=UPI00098DBA42|nr:serine hydroxymethyltransferase, mitochondrial-like [Cajanus cajan]
MTKIYLIVDFADGGELFSKLSCCGRLPESLACRYFAQLGVGQGSLYAGSLYYKSSLPDEAVYDKERPGVTWPKQLNAPLAAVDPEIANIIELEKARQWKGLELIPSENFTFVSVMQAVRSIMTNKYSEGYPGARYYGGNEYIDMAETLCQKRALEAFRLDPAK